MEILLTELLKQGPLIALMGVGLYVLYKKDETRRTNDLIERDAMRNKIEAQEMRIEQYFQNDSNVLKDLVRTCIQTSEKQTTMMARSNEVMGCIVKEIQEIKKSAIYKYYEEQSKNQES